MLEMIINEPREMRVRNGWVTGGFNKLLDVNVDELFIKSVALIIKENKYHL